MVWVLCILWQWISLSTNNLSTSRSQWQCADTATRCLYTQRSSCGKKILYGSFVYSGDSTDKRTGKLQSLSGNSLYYKSVSVSSYHWLNIYSLAQRKSYVALVVITFQISELQILGFFTLWCLSYFYLLKTWSETWVLVSVYFIS